MTEGKGSITGWGPRDSVARGNPRGVTEGKRSIAGWGALGAAAVLLAAMGGCGDATTTTTVRFWAMGFEGDVVAELMPDFERDHPGIRVDVQRLPWTSAHEKLLTAFVGDVTPDLAQLGNTWLPELATLGALEPLDAAVAASTIVRR